MVPEPLSLLEFQTEIRGPTSELRCKHVLPGFGSTEFKNLSSSFSVAGPLSELFLDGKSCDAVKLWDYREQSWGKSKSI